MDLVTVTDTILGLRTPPIRITEIEEDENGFLQITAEEFPLGAATATLYPMQPVTNNPITRNDRRPIRSTRRLIFEPPRRPGRPDAAGLDRGFRWLRRRCRPELGRRYVWLSLDDTSYSQIGTIGQPARKGLIAAALPLFHRHQPRRDGHAGGQFGRKRPRAVERQCGGCCARQHALHRRFRLLISSRPRRSRRQPIFTDDALPRSLQLRQRAHCFRRAIRPAR